jgi:group I intron endonuclease
MDTNNEVASYNGVSSGVYEIVFLPTGERYIGSAMLFRRRWRAHVGDLRRGRHHAKKLQALWTENEETSFEFRIVETCAAARFALRSLEQYFLDAYRDEGKALLNTSPSATNTGPRSRETVEKTARSNLGKRRSLEAKKRISEGKKGVKHSPTSRANMGKSRLGKPRSAIAIKKTADKLRGIPRTESVRAKCGIKNKGKPLSDAHKDAISKALLGRPGVNRGMVTKDSTKEKLRVAITGKTRSAETKARMVEAAKRVWAQRKAVGAILDAA